MVRFRRRCPLCFGLHGDSGIKQGQIAHLDGDRGNNRPGNLAFLCLAHHDSFDTTTSQSRGIELGEVQFYTDELIEYLEALGSAAWPDAEPTPSSTPSERVAVGVPLSIFELRLPMYRVVRTFLYAVVERPGVELTELLAFASATDEALFLFDDSVASYIREIYVKAVNLRAVLQRIEHARNTKQAIPPDLIDKDADLLIWFSGQIEGWRRLAASYLQVAGATPIEHG